MAIGINQGEYAPNKIALTRIRITNKALFVTSNEQSLFVTSNEKALFVTSIEIGVNFEHESC